MEYSENLLRLGTESAFEVLARAQSLVTKVEILLTLVLDNLILKLLTIL